MSQAPLQMNMFRAFRNAIALNNVGISFLERREYKQAVETLADAIQVMRSTFRPNPTTPEDLEQESFVTTKPSVDIDTKLQKAMKRIANTRVPCHTGIVEVYSHDDGDLASIKSAVQYGPSSSIAFPVRIRCSEYNESDDHDIDVQSAIILRNYGLALACSARTITEGNKSERLRQKAIKVFRLGQSLVCNRVAAQSDAVFQSRALLISAMLLNDIVQVLHELGLSIEASVVHERLMRLATAMKELDAMGGFGEPSHMAAAAA
jgi:hypothetical protein